MAKHHVHGSACIDRGYHSTARMGEGARIVSVWDHDGACGADVAPASSDDGCSEGRETQNRSMWWSSDWHRRCVPSRDLSIVMTDVSALANRRPGPRADETNSPDHSAPEGITARLGVQRRVGMLVSHWLQLSLILSFSFRFILSLILGALLIVLLVFVIDAVCPHPPRLRRRGNQHPCQTVAVEQHRTKQKYASSPDFRIRPSCFPLSLSEKEGIGWNWHKQERSRQCRANACYIVLQQKKGE